MAVIKPIESSDEHMSDTQSPSEAPQCGAKSQSPTQDFPLRFIDESQRQRSSQIRRDIRSHVRKGSHERQRRLNAAAKSRPLGEGTRKLLQKKPKPEGYTSSTKTSEDVTPSTTPTKRHFGLLPKLQQLQISPSQPPTDVSPISGQETFSSAESEVSGSDWSKKVEVQIVQAPLDQCKFDTTTPYALLLGKEGPILQMQARTWPFIQRISGDSPGVSVWMPCSHIPVPNIRSPRPCLLKSSKAVPWIANSAEFYTFKENTIRWVNGRLGSGDATHEKTIGGIACLMSWEIARGNVPETSLHMDGLQRIVAMRGGLQQLRHIKQFCWKIHLIDLLVAVLTSSQPRFWDQNLQRPIPLPFVNPSIGKVQIADSPLCGVVEFETLLRASAFGTESIELLQEMRDLTDGSRDADSSCVVGGDGSLFRIVNAASNIYRRAFQGIPFSSVCNSVDVKEICDALEDASNDETWTRYPGILLWIVLVGMVADYQRSFFTMWVFRVGTTAVWWGMDDATTAVMAFLRVKRMSEVMSK